MSEIKKRKQDHIAISLKEDVAMSRPTGFDQFYFKHQALPEIALASITLETQFLGHSLQAPILISSMTGGNEQALTINRHLAEAAQALALPMGVGSQRIIFEHPEARESFQMARKAAPDIPIFGNLGAVQLNLGIGVEEIKEAVDLIKGNGLFLHLNPLQEAIQPGGDTNFSGLLTKIGELTKKVNFPILVKEVGCGIAPELARLLAKKGVSAIDVSGAGGTSWASIEAHRAADPKMRRLGEVFRNWGIPTVESLISCREALPSFPLIASGGIRNGLDVAKALVLGADLVAFAMPLLEPATRSAEAVIEAVTQLMDELRVAMFLIGAQTIPALKEKRALLNRGYF